MNYDIIKFINITDSDIIVTKIETDDQRMVKTFYIEKILEPHYCPICKERMHSKGVYVRTINHSMLVDGYKVEIKLSQRRWRCTNEDCENVLNDEFNFVERYSHNSNATNYLILMFLKDINVSIRKAASVYKVSDTYVHNLFMRSIDLKRLPLPKILSIDEVFVDIDDDARYSVILRDFETDQIIDILPNRNKETLDRYFKEMPQSERNKVEIIISDMYQGYVNLAGSIFPNGKAMIDSLCKILHNPSYVNYIIM